MVVPERKMWHWVLLGWLGLERPIREVSATLMWMRKQRKSKVNWPHIYLNWGWVAWEKRQWYSDFIANSDLLQGKAMVFYGTMGSRWRASIPFSKGKVFVTQEDTVTRFLQYDDYLVGRVDLSLGFKPDDASRRIVRFPIWMEWLLQPDVHFSDLRPVSNGKWSPQAFVDQIEGWDGSDARPRFAGLVASHDNRGNGRGLRTRMRDMMSELGQVECAGKLHHNSDALKEGFGDDIVAYLETCLFNICFENVSAPHYCTEKLFQAFLAGCIPVYWGYSANPEPEYLTGNGIVFFDPDAPEAAMTLIGQLTEDEPLRTAWMRQPKFRPEAARKIEERLLLLESELLRISS